MSLLKNSEADLRLHFKNGASLDFGHLLDEQKKAPGIDILVFFYVIYV